MKKFLRNLFSGYFLVILLLLIELAIIVVLQFWLDNLLEALLGEQSNLVKPLLVVAYIVIRIIVFIVAFIIFFKIIRKMEDPEFKIPWIVGMLLLPFLTSVLYLIFGNHGLRKRDKRVILATREAEKKHFKMDDGDREKLGNAYGTFHYVHKTTGMGIHNGNRLTYYKNGEAFFPALMEGLRSAKEFIFVEFFIITDGKLWSEVTEILKEKAAQGVDIRIVYDDMGCGGTIASNTPKIFGKYGIKCAKFHPFRPILSGAYNNRDHRKIVVIDHKMAFTGGINLADEYANLIVRFGYWKDTMVKIEGSAINNLIMTFLQNYNLAVNHISDYEKFLSYEYEKYDEEGYVMPFGDGPGGIDDALVGEQNYINMLNYAKERVYISTPYLIPTYSLLDALRNAALRGVEVNLIVPGIPDKKLVYLIAKSHFRYLLDAGVNIYIYKPGFNHEKSMLSDSTLGFVGTINFDFRSLVHHFECGTLIYNNPCLKDLEEDFKEMLAVSEKVPEDYKLGKWSIRLCSFLKLFTALL